MPKRINYQNREDGIIPQGDVGALMKPDKLKEYYDDLPPERQQRMIAFLHSQYTSPELMQMLNVSKNHVHYVSKKYRDIIEAAQLAKGFAIASLSERKVLELLQQLDVSKISDEKKPQSIKYLVDAADISRGPKRQEREEKEEDTMELVLKIRKRMSPKKEPEPIDVTNDIIVEDAK